MATSFSYSITLILVRRGMTTATPLASIIVLNSVVSLTGLTIALLAGTLASAEPGALGWFVLTGVVGHGTGSLVFFSAIQRLGVSRATAIHSSTPLWGVVFAVAFLGEAPGGHVVLGVLGIVGGVFLLSWPKGRGRKNRIPRDYLLPLASSVCFALVPVFAKMGLAQQSAPYLGFGVASGSGLLLMLAARRLLPGGGAIRADARALGCLLAGAAFNVAAAFLMWTAFVAGMVSSVLPLSRMTPLWVVAFSFLFLGNIERVSARTALAACLVVAGGALIAWFR